MPKKSSKKVGRPKKSPSKKRSSKKRSSKKMDPHVAGLRRALGRQLKHCPGAVKIKCVSETRVSRGKLNPYSQYVKREFQGVRRELKGASPQDVMSELGARWRAMKGD